MLTRNIRNKYIVLLLMGLTLMLVAKNVEPTGKFAAIIFIFDVVVMIIATRSIKNIIFFYIPLICNFSLMSGKIMGISINNMVIFSSLFILLLNIRKKQKKELKQYLIFIVTWYMYMILNTIFIGNSVVSGVLTISIYVILAIDAMLICYEQPINSEKFILSYIIGITYIEIIAVIEFLIGHTFFYSQWTGTERYRNGLLRVGSTVADPNNICFFVIPFIFILESKEIDKLIGRRVKRTIQILSLFVIVFMTSSRTGLVTLIIGAICMFVLKRRAWMMMFIPVVGIMLNVLLKAFERLLEQDANSTNWREYIREYSIEIWKSHILFGVGNGNMLKALGISSANQNVMNTYVFCLLVFGTIGFLFFVLYWIMIAKPYVEEWINNKKISKEIIIKLIYIISILIIIYTIDVLYMIQIWIVPSIFHSLETMEKSNNERNNYNK